MNREQALNEARHAAYRARAVAYETEQAAREPYEDHKVARLAAAGALWADTARTYTALAAVLPEPPAADDTEPEADHG